MIYVYVIAALVYIGGYMWLLQDGRQHVDEWGATSWLYLLAYPLLFAIIPITTPFVKALGWFLRKTGRIS